MTDNTMPKAIVLTSPPMKPFLELLKRASVDWLPDSGEHHLVNIKGKQGMKDSNSCLGHSTLSESLVEHRNGMIGKMSSLSSVINYMILDRSLNHYMVNHSTDQ